LNTITQFFRSFLDRKGGSIFGSMILSKAASFLLSIILIRLVDKPEFGNIMYAYNIVSFIGPFIGAGLFQSLLQFGPQERLVAQKKSMFRYTIIWGTIVSLGIVALLMAFAPILTYNLPDALWYLIGLAPLLISLYVFESVKNYFRIFIINRTWAVLETTQAVLMLILGAILTYFWNGAGYIVAVVVSPLIISMWILIRKPFILWSRSKFETSPKTLWQFGVYSSFGGIVSQLIFSVDILSIGNILESPEMVAQYKAMSIIPFSLMFLPGAFIKTDFVTLVKFSKDKSFLSQYSKGFLRLFALLSVGILIGAHLFSETIISILFGSAYLGSENVFLILMWGVASMLIFRVPYGNILLAIGWIRINTGIAIGTLILDLILNYVLIPQYGIMGAGIATVISLWISGLISYLFFRIYVNQLN